jgi:HlyD family secretion protein
MRNRESMLRRSLCRNLTAGSVALLFLFGAVGGWAGTTQLSGAVIASGLLVIDGNVKKVQHPTGGVVQELLVHEGQRVKAGDVLVRLDDTVVRANLVAITKSLNQLRVRRARLSAERDGLAVVNVPKSLISHLSQDDVEAVMANERRLFDDRIAARLGQKARLAEQIAQYRQEIVGLEEQKSAKLEEYDLIQLELKGLRDLYDQGTITLNRVNNLERNAVRLRGEAGQLVSSIARTETRISEANIQLLQVDQEMRTDVAAEWRDLENEEVALQQKEAAALNELKHIEVKAPIAGAIHQLTVHTVGGVIAPAETLMHIVPQSSPLVVDARISPQDVDQLAVGQFTTLRLTAFNRNTTPELSGVLARISADLETDQMTGTVFYRAAIEIPETELKRLPSDLALMPGMPVEAFIKTSDRTLLSYLAKPITDHAHRAFREE